MCRSWRCMLAQGPLLGRRHPKRVQPGERDSERSEAARCWNGLFGGTKSIVDAPSGRGRSATAQPLRSRRGGDSSAVRKGMSTAIYVDSRKRVAGDDSSFEFHRGDAPPANRAKLDLQDARHRRFLSTDRGQFLYWIVETLQTLNWAVLPVGANTGSRLAA